MEPPPKNSPVSAFRQYKELQQKSYSRCLLGALPVLGNIVIGIWDFSEKKEMMKKVQQNSLTLKDAPEKFKNDHDIVRAAWKQNSASIQFASKQAALVILRESETINENNINQDVFDKCDREVQKALIQLQPDLAKFLDVNNEDNMAIAAWVIAQDKTYVKHLKADVVLSILHISSDGKTIINEHRAYRLLQYLDKAIVLEIVKENGLMLEYASAEMKKDQEIVSAAYENNNEALKFVSDETAISLIEKNPSLLKHAKKSVVLSIVKENSLMLQHASDEMKKDEEVVLAACKNNNEALKFASDETAISLIEQNPSLLKYANKSVVLSMVQKDGLMLQHASDEMKNDQEVVMAAFNNNNEALKFANDETAISLVKTYFSLLKHANKSVVLLMVQQDGLMLQHASDEMKKDQEIIKEACTQNINSLYFVSHEDAVLFLNSDESKFKYQMDIHETLNNEIEKKQELQLKKLLLLIENKKSHSIEKNYGIQDLDIIKEALKKRPLALEYFSIAIKANLGAVITAVTNNPKALKYADLKIQKYLVLENRAKYFQYTSTPFQMLEKEEEKEERSNLQKNCCFINEKQPQMTPLEKLKKNYTMTSEEIQKLVDQDCKNFQYVHDQKIAKTLFLKDPSLLKYANQTMALLLIHEDPTRLKYATKEVALIVLKENGLLLRYVDSSLKMDTEIENTATQQNELAKFYTWFPRKENRF